MSTNSQLEPVADIVAIAADAVSRSVYIAEAINKLIGHSDMFAYLRQ